MSNHGSYIINTDNCSTESAHVHRTTSYIADLQKNWAYKNKNNIPILKNSLNVINSTNFNVKYANTKEIDEDKD